MLELQPSRLPSLGPGRPSGPGLGGAGGWTDGRREEDSAAPRRSGRGAGAAAPPAPQGPHWRAGSTEPGAGAPISPGWERGTSFCKGGKARQRAAQIRARL